MRWKTIVSGASVVQLSNLAISPGQLGGDCLFGTTATR